ncbi:hypothetical protein Btru_056906 [Bulinus truncatus]|nr:hypothetical protein Btru_056906 [Bulinus truncatus]
MEPDHGNVGRLLSLSLRSLLTGWKRWSKKLKGMTSKIQSKRKANSNRDLQAPKRRKFFSHQTDMDKFTDDSQSLMHTSSDVRLSSQVTQLTNKYQGLLSLVKKRSQPSKAYVHPGVWGEALPRHSCCWREEEIRAELRSAKQDWEDFLTGLNDAQRHVDSYLHQWSSYTDGQDQMLRLVDSVIEKAQGVIKTTANSEVSDFITSVSSRYEKLNSDVKTLIQRSEQHVSVHQQYQDSMQAAVDWLASVKEQAEPLCIDTSGDKHTIQNKLDRLVELINCMPEGASKMKECDNFAQATMDTTSLKGRQVIQSDLDVLRSDWEDYTAKLNLLKDSLEQALRYWILYDSSYLKQQNSERRRENWLRLIL